MHSSSSTPDASTRVWLVRVGLALVVLVYLVYSSFGFMHPVLWGHYGHHTAEYMLRVKSSLRWHMVTPATYQGWDGPPDWHYFYFHHPIGYHHLLLLFTVILGEHDWIGSIVPTITGLFLLWALYALVKRYWSREWALVACAVWVGLPIITSFSILTDAMFPEMACTLLFTRAWLEYQENPSRKWLGIACLATALGGLLMWEAYFQAAFFGAHALALAATRKGRRLRLGRFNPWAMWIAATGATAAFFFAFHFAFVRFKGMWDDFFQSFHQRHDASWQWVYERHKQWVEILYGWPPVYLAFAWLAVFAVRLALRKARRRDAAVLICLQINLIYIYLFAEGSSVHLYRVFYFSSFLVLAITDLASDAFAVLKSIMEKRTSRAPWIAGAAVAAGLAVYFAVETPHAYANLLESRVMMGTHGLPGYNPDYLKQLFALEVNKRTDTGTYVFAHEDMPHRVEWHYYIDRSELHIYSLAQVPSVLKKHPRAVIAMDAYPPAPEMRLIRNLLKEHPGYLFDRYLLIDLRSNKPEFHEYVWEPQKPTWWWRWFVSHKYPPMKLREVSTSYGACVRAVARAKVPPGTPLEPAPPWGRAVQVVCYHNDLLRRGMADRAASYEAQLEHTDVVPRPAELGDLVHVVGLRAPSARGADLFVTLKKDPPSDGYWRWTLTPIDVPPGPPPSPGHPPAPPPLMRPDVVRSLGAVRTDGSHAAVPLVGMNRNLSRPTVIPRNGPVTGETRPAGELQLGDVQAGDLYVEHLAWNVPPGRYRLRLELVRPAPPPPPPAPPKSARPVRGPSPRLPPPPPAPPIVLGSADLGELQLR